MSIRTTRPFATALAVLCSVALAAPALAQTPPGHGKPDRPEAGERGKPDEPGKEGKPEAKPLERTTLVDVGPFRVPFAAGWVKQPPASRMRVAQALLPAPDAKADGAELVVYHFGKGQGGDIAANIARWKGQFERPEGMSDDDFAKETRREVAGFPVVVLEVRGKYLGMSLPGQPAPTPMEDARLHAVIVETDAGNWFIKTTGPSATMEHHTKALEAMVAGIERAAKGEGEGGKGQSDRPKGLPPGHP